ncbi:MAG: hypothetical protein UY26_C0003G0097 [Candidatus Jorgensenbacteria bacterium GW2011_GWA1_48_13]|uniref:Uncharacterized protein n=1 Tax=Candidatus Jorgensenbacteria bacterium GW2011_GWB1_50_10 TaxID=1618665 RepID=A0A0G1W8D3_9BACT|nr:MAG: hypothetical protein UY26_C0003G0097 [Candidatus Jorgensenbacteria bacterium GW2011_GWA1_48_13]KKW15056.1 MAG: hypothetical protein UY55_C0002G0114 [Candidatus Jorgensenbacteria bacterium GW2011_GWB1_50_10]
MPPFTLVDHSRELCGKPDIPEETPREVVERKPAHCLCCGSEMSLEDPPTEGQIIRGEYRFVCPVCPRPANLADF